ncbi:dynein regulatory complex subunit 4 isoform X2 [Parasteatoda tepidariorum]
MLAKKTGKKQFRSYAILGLSVADMNKDQLENHVHQLQQEVEKEKEERNFFQIERDKIQLFWEVTKTQLEEKDALLQLKDSEFDEAELSHLAEIKLYKQKMKQVMFECQQNIDEKMKEKMGEKLIIEEEQRMKIDSLEKEINKLKDDIFQLKISHENAAMEQRLKYGEELCALHEKYQSEIDIIKNKEVEEIGNIKNQLCILQSKTIEEVETLKDAHTQHLIQTHEELVQKMKNYYNMIIKNNVLMINSMKEKLQASVRKECFLKDAITDLQTENKRLGEKIADFQQCINKRNSFQDETHYSAIESALRNTQRELKHVKSQNDFLFARLQEIRSKNIEVNLEKFTNKNNEKV